MNLKLIPKGFLRAMIISSLEEKPMNGYNIIKSVKELTGFWKPSPGSVYPLLKTMNKEGIIKKQKNGMYELTKKGKQLAKKLKITREQWRRNFFEFLALACGIEKEVIEKEIKKRERIFRSFDPEIKKLLEAIIREIVKLQKDKTNKERAVKILEETFKKLKFQRTSFKFS